MRETNGNFDSCSSCKRLVPSRLHELHESKFPFVSRIEFIRSKLSNFSAHVYGATDGWSARVPSPPGGAHRPSAGDGRGDISRPAGQINRRDTDPGAARHAVIYAESEVDSY